MSWQSHHINTYLRVLHTREETMWDILERKADQAYWEVKYHGVEPQLTLRIELGPRLLHFHTTLQGLAFYRDNCLALYRYLLRLSDEMSVVKWGVTHEGIVTLSADWPTENPSFGEFETALRLFINYYRLYYDDVQLVAQDDGLARHIGQFIDQGAGVRVSAQIELDQPAEE